MHENVLAAAVPDDEPEPLIWVVPLHRADLLDGDLIRGLKRSLRSCSPRLLLQRGGHIDTQDLGNLQALLARCRPDFQVSARRHGAVAAALDDTHVEKGITAGRQLDKAKALFGVIPFDRGLNWWARRGGLEPGATLTRRVPKTGRWRIIVIIEASPLRSPGFSVFAHALLERIVLTSAMSCERILPSSRPLISATQSSAELPRPKLQMPQSVNSAIGKFTMRGARIKLPDFSSSALPSP